MLKAQRTIAALLLFALIALIVPVEGIAIPGYVVVLAGCFIASVVLIHD
jgi:hypothetical protein